MSTEVESSVPVAAEPVLPSPPATPASSSSPPTSPATGASRTPFKKEKKKVTEKTDEYLLARFQGDGVRYKAKLIGVDDVPEARGDKMSQDSMMKLKGMAVAGRAQGKHKQRIWVNISMSGIKIIDEKSGVIEHEHIVNKISFIARDVTDNRAFGYVCGAEGQHQFFAIKTGQQAEPLVIDLKDLFTVIFNIRKKEVEASKGGSSGTVVENGGDALLSVGGEAQTTKPAEQLDLFGDMSTPPDIHSPSETNDILLLDFSAEVDSNQNCIKGNPFVTCAGPNPWATPQTESPFSSMFGFFPTPDTDPFRDDPLSRSPAPSAPPPDPQISLAAPPSGAVPVAGKTIVHGGGLNGDSDHMGPQRGGLSNETMILALSNGQWPLGGMMAQESNIGIKEQGDFGPALSTQNPFLEASAPSNGALCDPLGLGTKDAVVISPPPQNTKAGRGRRSAKPSANDLFGSDLFAAQPEASSDPADLFASTPASATAASIAALGNLQLGGPVTCMPGTTWGATTAMPSMFSMPPGASQPAYPQPSAFGGLPIPPGVWGHQAPSPYGVPPAALPGQGWGHHPPPAGPMGAPGWGPPAMATNPFQPGPYAMMGGQPVPPRPPPRPPVKEAAPKVENSAFTALDPLGEKEKKTGKDMFKDFQMAKPPAIPARKGEQVSANGGGAFDQYFTSKVGVLQDVGDHDDFDIHEISATAPPDAAPSSALLAPSGGLLDAAFSPTPAPAPGPAPGLNQFDQAFGAPNAGPFGAPLLPASPPVAQTSGSSDPFGDPFGNPFA